MHNPIVHCSNICVSRCSRCKLILQSSKEWHNAQCKVQWTVHLKNDTMHMRIAQSSRAWAPSSYFHCLHIAPCKSSKTICGNLRRIVRIHKPKHEDKTHKMHSNTKTHSHTAEKKKTHKDPDEQSVAHPNTKFVLYCTPRMSPTMCNGINTRTLC